ncbi:MAG TPA: hypothetical protein VFW73_01340, partial [Lacipirellulaceae bacterium]|nr:hypothetical protein [Lacipirellulaceae bacterium]
FAIDKMWMAIPVALLTGLGTRAALAKNGRASYVRGAITVLLAMGAYLGGLMITRAVANHRAAMAAKPSAHAKLQNPSGKPGVKDTAGEAVAPPPSASPHDAATAHPDASMHRPAMPTEFSVWDYICLAAAALLAYELGRGSGGVPHEELPSASNEPVTVGTPPDA